MKKTIVAAIALLAATTAPAQEVENRRAWTLAQCIDYALEHNITLLQSQNTVQQQEVALSTARARRLPGVSASASENISFGRGLTADNTYTNSNTTSSSFNLGADLPIFQGLDIRNGIKLARLDLAAATADLEKARDDIRVNVAQAYIQILYNTEIMKVAQQQVEHDSLLLEAVEEKCKAGKASESEVTAQAAVLAQSRSSAIQATGNLDLSVLDLTQLLELPTPEGFRIATPSIEYFEQRLLAAPEEIYADAIGFKPAVKAAELRLEGTQVAIDRAKGAYLPSLSLNGGIGTNYYTTSGRFSTSFGEQMRNNFSQYLGLSLSVPIFTRFNTRNSLRTARLNHEREKLQLEGVKKSLYKEIQQAWYSAVAAQAKNTGSEEAARSALERYRLTEEKYISGKASITDCNEARNSWLSAESDRIRSRYECLYQTSLLDFYSSGTIVL